MRGSWGAVGTEVGDDRRENPGGDEVAEGLDTAPLAERGVDDRREAICTSLVPQANDGTHDPLPQALGLELGEPCSPVREVGVDPAVDSMTALAKSVARSGK